MILKKALPKDSKELARYQNYLLIEHTLNKNPYYSIYRQIDTSKGPRYESRGASSMDLERVKHEFTRITGKKLATQSK